MKETKLFLKWLWYHKVKCDWTNRNCCGLSWKNYKDFTKEEQNTWIPIETNTLREMVRRGKQQERERIIGEIEKMKIWSKGTAEGTRKDIIYRLTKKAYLETNRGGDTCRNKRWVGY